LFRITGPYYIDVDNRLMSLKLVKNGLTKTAMFGPDGLVLQPSEALYKKNALVMSGRFRPFTKVHEDMLATATTDFTEELGGDTSKMIIISELSLNSLIDTNGNIYDEDFIDRVNILSSLGHTVMITNFLDYWYLVPYLSKATRNQLVGFVLSVRNIERIFRPEEYKNLRGGLLEAFSLLFGTNVKAYAYPAYRQDGETLVTSANLNFDPAYKGLLQFLLDNNILEDIRDANLDLLHINADEVLRDIKNGTNNWEDKLPAKVATLIKENCLFDYPCQPNN